jgi:hypothetical protein
MSITLIMPCAGKSSRFDTTRPKYLLTAPSGNLMLMESLFGLDTENISRIVIVVARCHIEDNKVNLNKISEKINEEKGIIPEFFILDSFTTSQSETIYKTIVEKNIEDNFFIKDCDNIFNTKIITGNYICISKLNRETNAINKGYVSLNKFGKVSGIIEKQVIGDIFCCGGYSFSDPNKFKKTFEKLSNLKSINNKEIYISHVIQQMLLDEEEFDIDEAYNYLDFGTIEDWEKYTSGFQTIFIDMDGTLCEQTSEFFEPSWGESDGLLENIKIINELFDGGKTTIIITTSRKSNVKEKTINQLNKLGIKYNDIIFNLPHAKRILVNDFSDTNPYPSAIAVNLKRNSNNLKNYIKNRN